jgi:serine/threonine-protein kinase
MELVEGEDLAQRIARSAIPLDEALSIARQIAEALEAAHEVPPSRTECRATATESS